MPRSEKKPQIPKQKAEIPNYSTYEYAHTMPVFTESERILESDIHSLECYSEYELEALLNHFSDSMLNNHLYTLFKTGKLELQN